MYYYNRASRRYGEINRAVNRINLATVTFAVDPNKRRRTRGKNVYCSRYVLRSGLIVNFDFSVHVHEKSVCRFQNIACRYLETRFVVFKNAFRTERNREKTQLNRCRFILRHGEHFGPKPTIRIRVN